MAESAERQLKSSESQGCPQENRSEFKFLSDSIVNLLPIGIVCFDSNLRILGANQCAKELVKLGDYIDKSLAKGTDDKIWQGWTQQLSMAITSGKSCRFDDVSYVSSGKTRLLQIFLKPVKETETTNSISGIITVEDVTDKVERERKLAGTERLAAVGRHASKVAHELNNPLDGILRYLNLAIRIVEQENLQKPKEYLTQCREGLMRMVQIVSELLEFSRSTYTPMKNVKIEQLIEDVLKMTESKAEAAGVSIIRNYSFGLPQVRSGNLVQVFCNLVKNALDAMPDGGELRISTSLASDDAVLAEFRDTGTGLPPESIEAIFEPFYTTKENGKGTGLGLAICRDIVESYHGRIAARNAPDGGSIFTVYIPVAR